MPFTYHSKNLKMYMEKNVRTCISFGASKLKFGFEYFMSNYFWRIILAVISVGREIEILLATCFVMFLQVLPFLIIFTMLYAFESSFRQTGRAIDDPKNISLLDRLPAFVGLLVPIAEFSRFFPAEMADYEFMTDFQAQYLTGILVMLSANQFIPMILQMLTFREIIRRRGPDTQWAGGKTNKFWIKHYVRYFWCYGFLLTTILEPYAFAQKKLLELFDFPYWMDAALSQFCFWIFAFLLCHGLFFLLIGEENSLPFFHKACIFHVGKPKQKK
jgi:hypothetical protein